MNKKAIIKDKKNFMLIGGIILYGLVVAALFLTIMPKDKNTLTHNYLIIDGEYFYEYDNGNFKTISFNDVDFTDYLFKVYNDYKYSGEFYVSRVSSNYQHIKFMKGKTDHAFFPNLPFIAVTEKINYVDFNKEELDDEDIINISEFLSSKNMDVVDELYASYKVNLDIDKDNINETIYVISNFDYMDVKENMFSITYVKDGEDNKVLEEYYFDKDDYMEFIRCDLTYILKLNDSGQYVLVVSNIDDDSTINNFYVKNGNYYNNLRLS